MVRPMCQSLLNSSEYRGTNRYNFSMLLERKKGKTGHYTIIMFTLLNTFLPEINVIEPIEKYLLFALRRNNMGEKIIPPGYNMILTLGCSLASAGTL